MEQTQTNKTYHGNIQPDDFSRDLIAHFNRGNMQVQQVGSGDKITVQIATRNRPTSGGKTALSIRLQKIEDGVTVALGKQAWLGVAASLGFTALTAFRNPLQLLARLDDLAQDFEYLQLTKEVWEVMEATAKTHQASFEMSEKLKRLVCGYCGAANPVGEPRCLACGAPLGSSQPNTCLNCGYVVASSAIFCPNCGQQIQTDS